MDNQDSEKQKLLIEYLISSADTFALCQAIVQPEYFDPEFRNTVKFIKEYYNKYSATPQSEQIKAETGQVIEIKPIKKDQIEWCSDQIESFCKHGAMKGAFLSSVQDVNDGKYAEVETRIKDAMLVSLHRDLGLRYFDDPEERLQRMLKGGTAIPTGWTEVDELLFGGISRKELLVVSAIPGGGKSLTLANLGMNFVERGFDMLYITLELAQDIVAQRFDTMITGISRKVWEQHVSEIGVRVKSAKEGKGNIDIKFMLAGTTALEIRTYLQEYNLFYGKLPDLLIIDYLDCMYPNEKIDLSDAWLKDKLCSEQLRNLGAELNLAVATASQLNRSAVNATHHDYSQIAGGISKINTTDIYWSILFNEAQRAKGEIGFVLQKTRNSDGAGKTVYLKWDAKHLRVVDRDNTKEGLSFVKKDKAKTLKDSILGEMPSGNGLVDLMSSTR